MPHYYTLADYYDSFTGNVDYGRRADFLVGIFSKTSVSEAVLDAGCGTGMMSRLLMDRGYDVIGVDNSPEMMSVAREKNPEQLLLCQDITELDLYGTIQGAICLQDTLNHLDSVSMVERAVARISLFLEEGFYFVFDINTIYKHRNILADNAFIFENDKAFCVWRNDYNVADGSVWIRLDVFSENGDGRYTRKAEAFREILIQEEEIEGILSRNGLEIETVLDGETLDEVRPDTQRLLYVTRKIKK